MKIFIDSASLDEIKKASAMGLVDGVTTNPSLVAKQGVDFKDLLHRICEVVDGPISAEVVALDSGAVVRDLEVVARLAVAARDLVAGARGWVVAVQRIQRHFVQKSLLSQKRFRIDPVSALQCCRPTRQRHAARRFLLPIARSSPPLHFEFRYCCCWKLLSSFARE